MVLRRLQKPALMREAAKNKRGYNLILEILIFGLVFLSGNILASIPQGIGQIIYMFTSPEILEAMRGGNIQETVNLVMSTMPDWLLIVSLLCTVFCTAITILYCRLLEKRSLHSMGFTRHGFSQYLLGYFVGFGMFSAVIGLNLLFGGMTWQGAAANFAVGTVIAFFVGYLFQGLSEEVLCRGYFLVSAGRRSHTVVAIVANALIFACLHLGNSGIAPLAFFNLFLFGVFISLYFLYSGNLWGAAALHSAWNFVQGNVFGVSVSGMKETASVFRVTSVSEKEFLSGGAFGAEGGFCVTLVLLLATALMCFLFYRRAAKLPEVVNESVQEQNNPV